jgi:hypothetical protein
VPIHDPAHNKHNNKKQGNNKKKQNKRQISLVTQKTHTSQLHTFSLECSKGPHLFPDASVSRKGASKECVSSLAAAPAPRHEASSSKAAAALIIHAAQCNARG